MFNDNEMDDAVRIYIKIRYSGKTADRLIKQCMKKISKCLINVHSVLQYETIKLSYFKIQKIKLHYYANWN